jgi:hypothetical protein
MRDADIRRVLRQHLESTFKDEGTTMIIEELGLCRGTLRVDIAVVNGVLKGYEIKSDQDTLLRLSSQAATYNRVFDTMTVVVAERHLHAAEMLIPSWWAIQVAKASDAPVPLEIEFVRGESVNPSVDPGSLVQLLWRDEVLKLLGQIEPLKALKRKPRRILWETLATTVPLPELKAMVCACLRSRSRWRLDEPRKQDGETSQLAPRRQVPCTDTFCRAVIDILIAPTKLPPAILRPLDQHPTHVMELFVSVVSEVSRLKNEPCGITRIADTGGRAHDARIYLSGFRM